MFFLCLLAAPFQAEAAGCATTRPFNTKISIDLKLPEPVYDLKRDIADINKSDSSFDGWLRKNGMRKVWRSSSMRTLGYAEGGAGVVTSMSFQVWPYEGEGVYYCPYIKSVELSMMFRTRIVIPKNFKKGGCRFNTVHEHELRHYQTNRDTAREFVKKLYRDLPVIIKEIETRQPYVSGEKVQQTLDLYKASLKSAIELYMIEGMGKALEKRNGLIDSPEEYASAGPKMRACKD